MKYLSLSKYTAPLLRKRICTCRRNHSNLTNDSELVTVIYSKSNCPFENLALEEHIYDNVPFDGNKRLLYLWRNRPSIVIGRHQNPWLEVNFRLLEEKKTEVNICRRVSGGGTVYHDLGNLNLTFFTHRTLYNRKENLQFIIDTLSSAFADLNLQFNDKDDILLDSAYKVSGSAAKLGLKTAFHHCTLLCDTNLHSLSGLLRNTFGEVETNATKSRPSPISNLFEDSYSFEKMCKLMNKGYKSVYSSDGDSFSNMVAVNPLDCDSVADRVGRLKSWDWVYGKTPLFTLTTNILFKDGERCKVKLGVKKGVVHETETVFSEGVVSEENEDTLNSLLSMVVGEEFNSNSLSTNLLHRSGAIKMIGGVT